MNEWMNEWMNEGMKGMEIVLRETMLYTQEMKKGICAVDDDLRNELMNKWTFDEWTNESMNNE